ncbi:MAG: single-stranded-DNA-specific exonuclease RecJ [Bacilli bacterium]
MNFFDKLLNYYSLSKEQYKQLTQPVSFSSLPPFSAFTGMDLAVNRIKKAMANQEKIVIYGDYDCDGVMATAILVKAFSLLDYRVGYYLPSRYQDGYGLNEKMVEQFAEKSYTLIITVDNGLSQLAAVKKAKDLGIDTIITDHHQIQAQLPDALVILHPTFSHYGETVTCGAYVALMLATALLGYEHRYLVILAAIATMADMMVLQEYNRDLVRLGMTYFNEKPYPALNLLAGDRPYTEESFSLKIAPAINAVGRMVEDHTINHLVRYLLTDDDAERTVLFHFIKKINEARKSRLKDAVENLETIDEAAASIVILTEEKEGLTGLLATQYLNAYNKPTVIFAKTADPEILKGSARSKPGFHIVDAFLELEDLLLAHGGHAGAGGCSLYRKDLPEFKIRFNQLATNHPLSEEELNTIPITKAEINWDNYHLMRQLAPFGQGHPPPYFALTNIQPSALAFSKDHKHLLTSLARDVKIVGFFMGKNRFQDEQTYTLIGKFALSSFRNNLDLQFLLERVVAEGEKS